MDFGALTWPFSVGMLAAFNPCGFAMLPTYLSFFIGSDDGVERSRLRVVLRSIKVGLVLTAGFVAVFGGIGIVIATFLNQSTVTEYVGYITVAVGILLIPMGIAMALGRQITLRLPKMNKGTGSRESRSMFLFGVSYAVVSLSCTIGLFTQAVSNTFTQDGLANGIGSFIAYGVGMGLVILFLTVSLARAKSNVARDMRRILPYVGRVSGIILVIAGVYLINYGVWEIQILNDATATNPIVDRFLEFQGAVSNWINTTTTERLGVLSLFGISWALLAAWKEDEPDVLKRRAATATFGAVFLIVEVVNGFDFTVLPLWRFAINWPARIGNWFTDPLRGGVPLEIVFVGLVGWWAWTKIDRYGPRDAAVPAGAT